MHPGGSRAFDGSSYCSELAPRFARDRIALSTLAEGGVPWSGILSFELSRARREEFGPGVPGENGLFLSLIADELAVGVLRSGRNALSGARRCAVGEIMDDGCCTSISVFVVVLVFVALTMVIDVLVLLLVLLLLWSKKRKK